MPTADKAMKERDRTQMPVAKKERTDHKCLQQRCWWQMKNSFPNTSNSQANS